MTTTRKPASGPGAARSKAEHAYTVLRERVVNGRFGAGERLVIEQLARELDMSVLPVREAIRRLEAEGYLQYTRNVGATIREIDLDRYPETVESVAILESAALALALPHLTEADLAKARALNDKLRALLARLDPVRFTRTNLQFHHVLVRRCPNRHLLAMLEREQALFDASRRSAFTYIPERAAVSVAEHDKLLALLEAGASPDKVETFARNHRMRTVRTLLRRLDGDGELAPPGRVR